MIELAKLLILGDLPTGVISVAAAGIPGDYNSNGTVDAGDYVLWRKYNNTSTTLPNDATPGTNASDYTVWRSHFGQPPGSASGAIRMCHQVVSAWDALTKDPFSDGRIFSNCSALG